MGHQGVLTFYEVHHLYPQLHQSLLEVQGWPHDQQCWYLMWNLSAGLSQIGMWKGHRCFCEHLTKIYWRQGGQEHLSINITLSVGVESMKESDKFPSQELQHFLHHPWYHMIKIDQHARVEYSEVSLHVTNQLIWQLVYMYTLSNFEIRQTWCHCVF